MSRLIDIDDSRNCYIGMDGEYEKWNIDPGVIAEAQPQRKTDEWCTDCKEYDQERHCCPRWNRVIRETLKDAQPETHEKRTETHACDCISRQAAIDALVNHSYPVRYDFGFTSIENGMTVTGIRQALSELPTIEPQRWIPCSERLPEKDGEYLVACSTVKGKPCVYGIDTFANDLYQVDKYDFSDKKGKKGWVFFHDEYGYLEDKTVVAWMPLPDAYMGGR